MHTKVLCLLSVLSFAPVVCASDGASISSQPDYLDQIRWVDSANVDEMFKADIAAGKRMFYVYCAYDCNVPGIDYRNALVCYPTARYREMPGGTDAFIGGEYDRLVGKLFDFTESYNVKLAHYLALHDLSRCQPGEDWKNMVEKIDDLLGGFDERGVFKEWTDASYDKNAHRFRYATYLTPEHRKENFYKKLCAVTNASKLSGKIIFEIYDASTKAAQSSIACQDGIESSSDWKPRPGDDPVMPGFDDNQENTNSSG